MKRRSVINQIFLGTVSILILTGIALSGSGRGLLRVKQKPQRLLPWELTYRRACTELVDKNNPILAATLFVKAGELGAPVWVFSLAGKIYSEKGRTIAARVMLERAVKKFEGNKFEPRLKERLTKIDKYIAGIDSEFDSSMQTPYPVEQSSNHIEL